MMHTVSTNQIADILRFNDKSLYPKIDIFGEQLPQFCSALVFETAQTATVSMLRSSLFIVFIIYSYKIFRPHRSSDFCAQYINHFVECFITKLTTLVFVKFSSWTKTCKLHLKNPANYYKFLLSRYKLKVQQYI